MPVVTRDELEASLTELAASVPDPRAGILGPDSQAWRLGGDLGVFLGGGRAALLQLAHPMVAHAIDHHSRTRTDVVGRFQRTFRHVFAMLFGELPDALVAARRVHAIHSRIHGEISAQIGGWAAGTRYHANDVEALRWVHATLVDSTLAVRARLDGPLPRDVLDHYVRDLNRFAALFGIPRALLPEDHAAHVRYMTAMLASDRIAVSAPAREMGLFLFGRGGGAAQPALGRIVEVITAELLPAPLALAFGLRASPRAAAAGLAAFAGVYRQLPARVTALPAHAEARRRLAGLPPGRLAAWTERQLFGLAQRATGQPAR